MQIKFIPRITGDDVRRVMRDPDVDDEMALLGLTEKKAHDLVKKIMISATWNNSK